MWIEELFKLSMKQLPFTVHVCEDHKINFMDIELFHEDIHVECDYCPAPGMIYQTTGEHEISD